MENQRVRISKRMLKDALIDLLQEKDIKNITVYEICAHAQVNRTTFYKYYGSQQSLLEDIEKDVFEELEQRLTVDDGSITEILIRIAEYFEVERKKCRLLLNSTSDADFAEKLFSRPIIQEYLDMYSPKNYPEDQVEYIQTFIYNGGYALLCRWINAEKRETPTQMANLIQRLVSNLIGIEIL